MDGQPGRWPGLLFADAIVAFVLLVAFAAAIEVRRRRRPLWRVSLAEILLLMLVTCSALGWWMSNLKTSEVQIRALAQHGEGKGFGGESINYRGPTWLRRMVGLDLLKPFRRVVCLQIDESNQPSVVEIANELPDVERLMFRGPTIVDEDLRYAANFKYLRGLIVVGTDQITDAGLAHLKALKMLEALDLRTSESATHGWDILEQMKHLRLLCLHMPVPLDDDILNRIARLPQLQILDLSVTGVDSGLEVLSGINNLRILRLHKTKIDSRGVAALAKLTRLEYLELNDTTIDDQGLRALESLQELRLVDLRDTRVTLEGVRRFQDRLPDCRTAWFRYDGPKYIDWEWAKGK